MVLCQSSSTHTHTHTHTHTQILGIIRVFVLWLISLLGHQCTVPALWVIDILRSAALFSDQKAFECWKIFSCLFVHRHTNGEILTWRMHNVYSLGFDFQDCAIFLLYLVKIKQTNYVERGSLSYHVRIVLTNQNWFKTFCSNSCFSCITLNVDFAINFQL